MPDETTVPADDSGSEWPNGPSEDATTAAEASAGDDGDTAGEQRGNGLGVQMTAAAGATIDQVRELLFGEQKREHDHRLVELADSLHALEQRLSARLDELGRRLDELAETTKDDQAQTINSIGSAIANVGWQIAALGVKQMPDDASRD